MAGHSKWSNTKHRKSSQDIKRSRIFTKLIREITIASTKQGQDPKKNFYLRTVLDKANMYNMTKNTIDRAIQRSIIQNNHISNIKTYSGYGPGGIAFIIECSSDNNNHTVSKLREIFSRCKGTLVKNKNVEYLFQKIILLKFNNIHQEKIILDIAAQHEAYTFKVKKNKNIQITIPIKNFKIIKKKLCKLNIKIKKPNFYKPITIKPIDTFKKVEILKLINKLNEFSEIKNIYYNIRI
ncbi:hypothetical protein BCTU_207 [Buchnera aphidicola (Cinara tujafilina)]|uniref:Probable transcriptional regulatory protein BCTU_207 n=1 Tax=Buchnera aphidicola (Cinara tujafilina) TaxID=261317 RepID=F7WZD0_9GAMM|nr:YebC/PmpR family DNA-binding transcriptional regulator [Buchnera aphidicola]AEH39792.1 hypothetical protein BCTU_207 [Buchnera aphidicola (Cinara tujafilina)]